MSLARINWLAPNFGTRNDLVSVFHQILTFSKGVGGTRLELWVDINAQTVVVAIKAVLLVCL